MRNSLWCCILAALLLATASAFAADQLGYYRFPTVYGDKVVFTADGDLWEAPLSGGIARRLTIAPGQEQFAMFSPDGKWIAFSGNYDGNLDAYVMPSGGGEPVRLTFHPDAEMVAGWTPDGKVVFRSASFSGQGTWKCFSVSPQGGYPEVLPIDEAAHVSFEPNGDRVAYTRISRTGATWKRYKGGLADQIWVGSTMTHDYQKVSKWDGHNAIPMWHRDRIYYIRDDDNGRTNLFSMKPDGSDVRAETNHTDWDARWPTLSQGKIAYSLGADIWVYDIESKQDRKIDIYLPSDHVQARDKFISPDEYTNDFGLSQDGKMLMVSARGDLFTAPTARRGIIKRISRTAAAREKGATFMPNGESILAWSDMSGEEALYLFPTKGTGEPKRVASGTYGYNFQPEVSNDGKWAVFGDANRRLQLLDLATGKTTAIDTSNWEIHEYEWSPDSRYIAYSVTVSNPNVSAVKIYDTQEHKAHQVTDELFTSYSPTWDPQGKWLYFISSRFMNPYNSVNDWSFVALGADRVYGLSLDAATPNPYAYTEDGTRSDGSTDADDEDEDDKKSDRKSKDGKPKGAPDSYEGEKKKDDKAEKPVKVKIDWDGLTDRLLELPLKPGNYIGLSAIEGKIYYLTYPLTGWRSGTADDGDGPEIVLHLYDIKKRKNSDVVEGVRGYSLSRDRKKIAVRKKDDFVIMDAGDTEEPEANKHDKDAGLHLEDWVYDVDPRQEWKQIFAESWRLERDFFYDPNMHGVDWAAERRHYEPLLDRINTRAELNDVMGQMFGELSAGHAYVGGGDLQSGKYIGVGLLGADISRDSSGYFKIDHILRGEPWDPKRSSALAGVGVNAKDGEYIVAIDDVPTNTVKSYLELLLNKARKPVSLSINSKPSLEGARKLVVKTLGSEGELRYWDWVYGRMEYVKKNGGENIAYVHLSDMGTPGLEEWFKEYYSQSHKKALIMDVRYNGGGNIAPWILSQLDRKVWTWKMSRNGSRFRSPDTALYGPMIALCNEETGSDGETFSEGWKRLKLGPLVGKRTWGGWVGIRGFNPAIDRGFYTQPEFTGWGAESKWLIEGPGVYPDVEVENHPLQMMQGYDEQLDYALNYLKDQLKNNPMPDPPMPPFPNKAAKISR